MNNALVTLAIGDLPDYSQYTLATMQGTAYRHGWDFYKINEMKIDVDVNRREGWERILFQKFQVADLLDVYDRIVYYDLDVVLSPSYPDIFKIVPVDEIGGVREDIGSRASHRRKEIRKAKRKADMESWESCFLNAGFFVLSREHKEIYDDFKENILECYWTEQTTYNYLIQRSRFNIYELPFTFNHMSMFSEKWNGYSNRLDSYAIHYAGGGFPGGKREDQIKSDYKEMWR
jgi:lipopolysaccharide biosynthesis glycosyltransferase